MASFKALCLAGVASLVATAAGAADLLPPPPAPVYAPAPVPVAVGGGWYLRGDVGVGMADLNKPYSTFTPGYVVSDLRHDVDRLEDSAFFDAGVGYRINEFFRVDVTGEYRTSSRFSAVESYSTSSFCVRGCIPRGYDQYTGQFQTIDGLFNVYADVFHYAGASFFLGGGAGVARVGVNDITDTGVVSVPSGRLRGSPGGFGFSHENYQTNFAWALMAGVDFAVTQNLKLELGYRYLNVGDVASGVINCVGACQNNPREVQHHQLAYNDFRLGFRYTFADLVPVAAPSFPLVRKY